MKIEDICAL